MTRSYWFATFPLQHRRSGMPPETGITGLFDGPPSHINMIRDGICMNLLRKWPRFCNCFARFIHFTFFSEWKLSHSCRRKFRSQTSDNMDRWKSRGGKSQGGEANKWEDQRRERVRRKKLQVRKKVGKSRFNVIFQWFVALDMEGRRVGSLKRRGAEPWGQMRDEKLHAVVARSTFPSEKAKNPSRSDHFWKLRCRKSARRCGTKHISKSKCTRHTNFGPYWKLRCRKSERRCGAKRISKSKVKSVKNWRALTFRCQKSARRWGAKHIWKSKVSKTAGFEPFLTFRCRKSPHWPTTYLPTYLPN